MRLRVHENRSYGTEMAYNLQTNGSRGVRLVQELEGQDAIYGEMDRRKVLTMMFKVARLELKPSSTSRY
jgi:hypothetical protein